MIVKCKYIGRVPEYREAIYTCKDGYVGVHVVGVYLAGDTCGYIGMRCYHECEEEGSIFVEVEEQWIGVE